MSVYTRVSPQELAHWLNGYGFCEPVTLEPILEGITNTNYFVVLPHGRFVLTLFETLTLEEVPFYLELMQHLARHAIACPAPLVDQRGRLTSMLAQKPACLVTCLSGCVVDEPNLTQCQAMGVMLANMHLAGNDFAARIENPRGFFWWQSMSERLYQELSRDDARILYEEMHAQHHYRQHNLPCGIIHADLFKDNVLMHNNRITGFIDFYYAGYDYFIYDIAVALNSWASLPDGDMDNGRSSAILQGYQSVRNISAEEKIAWPLMLRAAALRFWLSRLYDALHPLSGELTYIKDPDVFRRILLKHRDRRDYWL